VVNAVSGRSPPRTSRPPRSRTPQLNELARSVGNRAMGRLLAPGQTLARCGCGGHGPNAQCAKCQDPGTFEAPLELEERALRRAAAARAAGHTLMRLVGRLDCTGDVASAPDNPAEELTDIDAQARNMATRLAADLAADSATVRDGIPDSPSDSLQSYLNRFGQPPPQDSGFLNRITGIGRPTLAQATSEELRIMSRRFSLIARLLGDRLHYACGAGPINLGGGCADDCSPNDFDAFTCRGASGIGLCPSFWGYADNTARAAVVIHELFHTIWGPSNPRSSGEIGDETLRGAGRNFDVSGCWESLVDDVFGTDSGATCPAIP
jgi:hypothetical protein